MDRLGLARLQAVQTQQQAIALKEGRFVERFGMGAGMSVDLLDIGQLGFRSVSICHARFSLVFEEGQVSQGNNILPRLGVTLRKHGRFGYHLTAGDVHHSSHPLEG